MSRKLVIAAVMGLAMVALGCSELQSMVKNEGGDGGTYMGGSAPTPVDPAGTATIGTGSTSFTDANTRSDVAAGVGINN